MRFDNLHDWLRWQETLHPSTIDMGLERVRKVWDKLHPRALKPAVITVSGTNGKGSCSAMLESVYRHAGYHVGCYSSPHLLRYNERIRIDGNEIADQALCEAFGAIDQARDDISITYFEFGTLAALYLFAQYDLDVLILEVGLGGRLDAVNMIDADVALLVSVGLDHQEWLGHDREAIGLEKAGIFRANRPAICAEKYPPKSVLAYASEIEATSLVFGRDYRLAVAEDSWSWSGPDKLSRYGLPEPSLRGHKQLENAAAVIMVLETLSDRMPVSQSHLRQGLREVGLPGRFQVLAGDPAVVLDVSHNPQAIEVLVENLQAFACPGRILAVIGMLEDKDVHGVVRLLKPCVNQWYPGGIDAPRGLNADQLAAVLISEGIHKIHQNHDITSAFDAAKKNALPGDCILVCGSFYSVGDILRQQ